ncbi:MAG: acetoin utilization protein AcuC [Armatimonadetes bacterium]|nr:acetoin utilization protein AcuC [Armatimonadota bacterium]
MKACFVYCDEMTKYDMGVDHPLRPERLRLTKELISAYGLIAQGQLIAPELATEADILTVHKPDYIAAVRKLSEGKDISDPWRYGFDYGDNKPFLGMYEASLLYTGASIKAAELIMEGQFERCFNISGGLHHAMTNRASGFCIFNDPAIAIRRLQKKFSRIAYIDIDAHHGDGVQHIFYDTNTVLTISMHESGRYLFPGTGFVNEIGTGKGKGYSVNIPLEPYTPSDVMVWAFKEIVPPLIKAYDPQVIVAQLGVDSHFQDPLAHLELTSKGFDELVKTIISFERPLVALGGGGYNISTVARLWTLAYARLLEVEISDVIPANFASRHNIHRLHDVELPITTDERRRITFEATQEIVQLIKEIVFPYHFS